MSDFAKFRKIREIYAYLLPIWMGEYERTGEMRQDPYFMDWEFTPIERPVWADIRQAGIPFFPQLPVLNYFLDFGCPFLKIGIECDGKAWHDHELDKARDARLAKEGWMIFRIEGHECKRIVDHHQREEFEEDEHYAHRVDRHYMETSEGVITAIKRRYFDDEVSERYAYETDATLFEHRSTPETFPVRRPWTASKEPIEAQVLMQFRIEQIIKKLQEAA